MKKLLKENKGFSLVELLIALLIMAVIAGTAITLFGGVLETSKVRADKETAESIKRAILTYMNVSNDVNLSALNVTGGTDATLISALSKKIEITDSGSTLDGTAAATSTETNDLRGEYGPFFEKSVIKPEQSGMEGWDIKVNSLSMVVSVESTSTGALTLN